VIKMSPRQSPARWRGRGESKSSAGAITDACLWAKPIARFAADRAESERSRCRHMLRATYGDLGCAENYVAHGFCGARCRATRVPSAPCPRAAVPIVQGRAQHSSAGFAIATVAPGLDHETLDSTDVDLEAATERKPRVHDRVGVLDREPCQLLLPVAPLALVESFNPPEICCAAMLDPLQPALRFDRGQHSSEGNIGRQCDRAVVGGHHGESSRGRKAPSRRIGAQTLVPEFVGPPVSWTQRPGTQHRRDRRCSGPSLRGVLNRLTYLAEQANVDPLAGVLGRHEAKLTDRYSGGRD
jgi:hypothetical protein